jgi:hypothetical protein
MPTGAGEFSAYKRPIPRQGFPFRRDENYEEYIAVMKNQGMSSGEHGVEKDEQTILPGIVIAAF